MTADDRKAIVFCDQAESVPLVVAALEASDVATASFTGAASRAKRDKAIAADWTVLVTTVAAGGVGLNLTQASRAVFFEPLLDIAAFRQAIGRVHRIGRSGRGGAVLAVAGTYAHAPVLGHEAHERDGRRGRPAGPEAARLWHTPASQVRRGIAFNCSLVFSLSVLQASPTP